MLACTRAGHVKACRKLSRTRCRAEKAPAGILDRRGRAPGGHNHRLVSNLKPFSSQRALRELLLRFQQ
eukprot:6394739-Pyramimonas_sp.AAC.1